MNDKKVLLSTLCALCMIVLLGITCLTDNVPPDDLSAPLDTPTDTYARIDDAFSYVSDMLEIKVSFPAEWAELVFIADWVGFDGFVLNEPDPIECIALFAVSEREENVDGIDALVAAIYWRRIDDVGPEGRSGECEIMTEVDGYQCVCWLPMNTKIGLEDNPSEWAKYATVENGILNGEYKIELLDTKNN